MKKGIGSSQVKNISFNAKNYAKPGLSEDQVNQIKEAFDLFDVEGTGSIDPKQLKSSMQSQAFDVKNQTIYQLICNMDADGAGQIFFSDFLHLLTAQVTQNDSRETLGKVFALFDDEKAGFISLKNLRRICKELGETIEDYELQNMIERADLDNDGLVSEEQFYMILTGKGK